MRILLHIIILDFNLEYSKLKTQEIVDGEFLEKDSVFKSLTLKVFRRLFFNLTELNNGILLQDQFD